MLFFGYTNFKVGLGIQMEIPLGVWKYGAGRVLGLSLWRWTVGQEAVRIKTDRNISSGRSPNVSVEHPYLGKERE